MNEEQKQAIKELKHFTNMTVFWKEKEYTSHEIDNCINIVLHLIDKQQKEIENYQILKDDIEGHNVVYVDTPEFEENYISKDKIKAKIEEITSYAYTSAAERDCQDYAIQSLKELLGE